ncbi:RDD family protein [Thiomicrorhabdus sp. Milos-T2]|uniref:RDD family protein n=1 Tax=Thiomicrorhabdus sp. Milos-T2 TaxID=90814 RepID=UPI0009FF4151|nr:RDD family protein [Thiomicrorhabdus sp. Milos-T2]
MNNNQLDSNEIDNNQVSDQEINSNQQTLAVSYGGFWKRLGAYIIDWLILAVISVLLMIMLGVYLAYLGKNPDNEAAMMGVSLIGNLVTLFIAWFYYAGMESSSKQATYGKSLLGMKVTDLHGERISFLRASVRYFSKILSVLILFIGFIMIAFTSKKQGLHDMIASTLVVNK